MCYHVVPQLRNRPHAGTGESGGRTNDGHDRLVTDGGESSDTGDDGDVDEAGRDEGDRDEGDRDDEQESADTDDQVAGVEDENGGDRSNAASTDDGPETAGGVVDRPNVEVTEAGEAEPVDPKWEPPDIDDIPEFEVRADEPVVSGGTDIGDTDTDAGTVEDPGGGGDVDDPTAGMPNTARAPGATRISSEGTEAYIVALEMCARLPNDVRLPEEAAELVPTAVEAELEQDVQQFAASEFGTQTPHVDTLTFEDVDGEIWLRLRIGLPTDGFADIDPEEIRSFALEQLEGVL